MFFYWLLFFIFFCAGIVGKNNFESTIVGCQTKLRGISAVKTAGNRPEYLMVLDIIVAQRAFVACGVLPLAMFCGKTGFSQTKRMGLRDERLFHTPHNDG
ncbi:hypothetical protein [Profundibacter sp.]